MQVVGAVHPMGAGDKSRRLVLLVIIISVWCCAGPALADRMEMPAELFGISGCQKDDEGAADPVSIPQRARRCFKGSSSSISLTIRGNNFPSLAPGEVFEVELVEAEMHGGTRGIPPLRDTEEKEKREKASKRRAKSKAGAPPASPPETAEDDTAGAPQGARLTCSRAAPSSVFPTQLMTCDVRHPSDQVARGGLGEETLQRWMRQPAWMDLFVFKISSGERSIVLVARRVVEVDLSPHTAVDSKAEAASSERAGEANDTRNPKLSLEALERLYAAGETGWAEFGVGGLKKELHDLFRRVFLSRIPSVRNITGPLGLQHVRGVILHGRPGTGKTLIARTLTEALGEAATFTIVHAADVLSKYVGESERNLQRIFDRTRPLPGESGEDGEMLHVIVIDEIETLFMKRGFHDGSSASSVYEGVTNTLLSLMDGVASRNDILVFGITNRIDAIDQAMLRPGRFEVVLHVPDPDTEALEEIFAIHSDPLRQNHFLAADVDTASVATRLHGMSGADVAGVVRSAISVALEEYVGAPNRPSSTRRPPRPFRVGMSHFEKGIREIRRGKREGEGGITEPAVPTSTSSDSPFSNLVDHDGSLHHNLGRITSLYQIVQKSKGTLFSGVAVIQGSAGTGKTTAARSLYHHPFAGDSALEEDEVKHRRYVSCRALLALSLEEAVRSVQEVLRSAVMREEGTTMVVLDDIDVLLDAAVSYPLLDTVMMNALHEYMRSPPEADHTRYRSAGVPLWGSASAPAPHKRLLLLTVSRPFNLRPGLRVDITAHLHTVYRSSLYRLLPYYNIFATEDSESVLAVAPSYPSSMSFAHFMRLTEMALWRIAAEWAGEADFRMPHAFMGDEDGDSPSSSPNRWRNEPPALSGIAAARQFAAAVRSVSAAMGNLDPFRSMETHAEPVAGETVEEVLW